MRFNRTVVALGVLGATCLCASQAANAVTLKELIDSGSVLTQGDKIYSNFSLVGYNQPAGSGVNQNTQVNPSNITVDTLSGQDGVRFTFTNNAMTTTGTLTNIDAVIGYDLNFRGAAGSVSSVNLSFNTPAPPTGAGIAHVSETINDLANAGKTYNLTVFQSATQTIPTGGIASVDLTPASNSLHLIKDINVTAVSGSASISFVDNAFLGGGTPPGPIPEPMSLALLPLAIVGLGLRKKLAR